MDNRLFSSDLAVQDTFYADSYNSSGLGEATASLKSVRTLTPVLTKFSLVSRVKTYL